MCGKEYDGLQWNIDNISMLDRHRHTHGQIDISLGGNRMYQSVHYAVSLSGI